MPGNLDYSAVGNARCLALLLEGLRELHGSQLTKEVGLWLVICVSKQLIQGHPKRRNVEDGSTSQSTHVKALQVHGSSSKDSMLLDGLL